MAVGPSRSCRLSALYGANASGKTKVLEALIAMRTAVLQSVDWFGEREPVRRTPFLLDAELACDPSFFEVDLEIGGTRYTYGFKLDDERVRAEWLHAYPKGRRQVWFDRGNDGKITFPVRGCAATSRIWPGARAGTPCF